MNLEFLSEILQKRLLEEIAWLRHNETQRHNFFSVLLAVMAAFLVLVGLDKQLDPCDSPALFSICMVAILGIVAVHKYWERFEHHACNEFHILRALGQIAAHKAGGVQPEFATKDNPVQWILDEARKEHERGTCFLVRDCCLKQHWLWTCVFVIVLIFAAWSILQLH